MRTPHAVISVLVLLTAFLGNVEASEREVASFARSGGVYAGGAQGGVFGLLNTLRAHPETDINDRLRAGREAGLINVVQLNYQHRWNGEGDDGLKMLTAWLARTDLSLVDVVHFAEEQPYNAAQWLDPLYDAVKAQAPDLPVYVWPSYPLGPMAKADGYVYDAYGEGYTASRRRILNFLRSGKPLFMCIDASGFSDLERAREQLMVCHEFDIPVFYFVADSGKGSYNNWYGNATRALSTCRNFMFTAMEFQRWCRSAQDFTAGDLVWGEPIELAPNEMGQLEYDWTGFGPATVYGFTRLAMENKSVANNSDDAVAFDFQFWSEVPVHSGQLTLELIGQVESDSSVPDVALSRCGKEDTWQVLRSVATAEGVRYELGEVGQEFRVRVRLPKGMAMRGGRVRGQCPSSEGQAISLDAHFDGWKSKILYRQNLDVGLWRAMAAVENPEALPEGKGLALRGMNGRGVSVDVVEKFSSKHALEQIIVRLEGMSHSSLGGSFALGLSLDGKTILKEGKATTERRSDGLFQGSHLLDVRSDPEFTGIQTMYVHLIQKNGSGIQGNISSRLDSLEIDATRVE